MCMIIYQANFGSSHKLSLISPNETFKRSKRNFIFNTSFTTHTS
uniref:Uncharacterized protein n=1 Tax=Arundo donax TaxID=35708 RepID=A0A0A9HV55_ARUDO